MNNRQRKKLRAKMKFNGDEPPQEIWNAEEKNKIKNSNELHSEITETDFISLEDFKKKIAPDKETREMVFGDLL